MSGQWLSTARYVGTFYDDAVIRTQSQHLLIEHYRKPGLLSQFAKLCYNKNPPLVRYPTQQRAMRNAQIIPPVGRLKQFALAIGGWGVVCFLAVNMPPGADAEETGRTPDSTYERHVRPLLKVHCFQCHGDGIELAGGLDLRLRRLITAGGESGAAVIPGDRAGSLLFERIVAGEMPPEEVEHRLKPAEIETIGQWIATGASGRDEPDTLDPTNYITDEEREFWAFQPVRRAALPAVRDVNRVRTPIDRFLLARLERDALSFAPDADRATLLRRLYFDLTGLPPSVAEARQFLDDTTPAAYQRLVDRLLNSPRYGERWGRHWLDVAGYADSEGYVDEDTVRPHAFRYRDYVIDAFNNSKPFDQFIVEQLAGDELLEQPFNNLSFGDAQKLIATGFLRMCPDGTAASDIDQSVARNAVVAKTIEIVSTSLLGLTVGCAECHNHRYDPISQADYYAWRAIFEPALNWKAWQIPAKRRVSLYTDIDRQQAKEIETQAKAILARRTEKQEQFIKETLAKQLAKLPEELRESVREAQETPAKERTADQKQLLKEHPSVNVTASSLYLYDKQAANVLTKLTDEANALRKTKPEERFVRALWEPANQTPPKTFLFVRGDHGQPQQELAPRRLAVLSGGGQPPLPLNDAALPTSGRRLAFAKWLTSPDHPLVARVIVNRIWLHHFGQGLVVTPGDFGKLGVPPTHPELLDWLAAEFIAGGWDVKQLHRLILTSTAYRQASRNRSEAMAIDAQNRLYWRMPVRRMEAEVLRDSLLAVSGQLNFRAGGPPVPVMADRAGRYVIGVENLNAGRPGAVVEMHGEQYRRSVFVQVRRSRPLDVMDSFDLPIPTPNCTKRTSSTGAPQSLMLMNSDFVVEVAQKFADRLLAEAGTEISDQIKLAWHTGYARQPDDEELAAATQYLQEQLEIFAANPPTNGKDKTKHDPRREALASLCHAILSSNAFLYVD